MLDYADEIGVPFAVTVDFDTLKDNTVTLRDCDSTLQVRLHKKEVTGLIHAFVHDKMTWEKATEKYPFVKVDEEGGTAHPASTNGKATTVVEKDYPWRLFSSCCTYFVTEYVLVDITFIDF
jgi:hypothetical protein